MDTEILDLDLAVLNAFRLSWPQEEPRRIVYPTLRGWPVALSVPTAETLLAPSQRRTGSSFS